MPRVKSYIGVIPKIYRRKYEDIGMFFFVEGIRRVVPTVSIEQALCHYFSHIGVDNYNLDSAMVTYTRMKREFYEAAKET